MDIHFKSPSSERDELWYASQDMLTTVSTALADLLKENVCRMFGEQRGQPYFAKIEGARVATVCTCENLFSCDELTRVMRIWSSYMSVRRIENPKINLIERTFMEELNSNERGEVSGGKAEAEVAYPIAKSFVEAVVVKRIERIVVSPDRGAITRATQRTVAKCALALCLALRADESDLWMGQLTRVVRFMNEPAGRKLSVIEGRMVSVFQQLSAAAINNDGKW